MLVKKFRLDFLLPLRIKLFLAEGMALHRAGQLADAEKIYNQILARQPDHFDSLYLLGVIFCQRGAYAEAVQQIGLALKKNPNDPFALNYRGLALMELKRFKEALASFDRAITLRPNYTEALANRGAVLSEMKRFEEALASYGRALTLRPDLVEVYFNRGATLKELKRFEEALASYDRALNLRPDYPEAFAHRGATLKELKRFDEALASYDRALNLRPDYPEAFAHRGATLHKLKRFEEALASFNRALTLRPDYWETLANRGATLTELKRFKEALVSYDRALKLRPTHAETHCNEAMTRLLIGDFELGWKKYEWRWKQTPPTSPLRDFTQPQWLGEAIEDKAILLHSEQGFGDAIQFCRYVPLVAERAGRVVLEVQKSLHEIMSAMPGLDQIVSKGDALPHFDRHCPLLSIPLAFGTGLESIPSNTPYLQPPACALQHWKTQLGSSDRPRIGICWAGNPNFKGDMSRSMGLPPMLPLLSNANAQFFSLQKDLRAGDAEILQDNPHITHLGQELETFSDTAAIISLMDLIISTDTSVAHLAGALGKRVWILLQFVSDWRWLLDRDDSPWYPTARLFRQDDTRNWGNVIARVHAALHEFVQRRL